MRIRIGIRGARELDIEVEDPEAVLAAYQAALKEGAATFQIEETGGGITTIVVQHVAYIMLDAPHDRSVGFSV